MKPDFRSRFLVGVEHFNALEFWEAHEAWEELWLKAESEAQRFLQGLIQVAAGYHHMKRGTFPGAIRLFDAGLAKLEPFPPLYCGVERDGLVTAARQDQQRATRQLKSNGYPRIILTGDWTSRVPPTENW